MSMYNGRKDNTDGAVKPPKIAWLYVQSVLQLPDLLPQTGQYYSELSVNTCAIYVLYKFFRTASASAGHFLAELYRQRSSL